jgi:hypothetical protein
MRAVVVGLVFCFMFIGKAYAFVPSGNILFLDVTAKIDGTDYFEMTGDQWRWQHIRFDLPEQHEGVTPTYVNGQSFVSTWPSSFSNYNVVSGLNPIQNVLDASQTLYFEPLAGRGISQLSQLPTAENSYTFRVYMNDDNYGGHDFYRFQIWGAPMSSENTTATPEPASLLLFGLGGAGLAFRRFRQTKV